MHFTTMVVPQMAKVKETFGHKMYGTFSGKVPNWNKFGKIVSNNMAIGIFCKKKVQIQAICL